ncbi:MAG TPA: FAD-binding protein [Rhodopila sp.]|uniref:FAD-binding protein n=1 Tax=Rhodopila sp. TaxID=2480087 RepID=UPI002C16E074|nr:FAD-binding protein [Rhodopila sp.]HVY14673.1 FAD-binding protein [Rhodopila sp.]
MTATMAPADEDGIVAAVAEAAAAREPLLVQGNATKSAMLRPVQAARTLSTAGLSGISLYAPKELIISARAGTPLREVEAALSEAGQHLIAEPPDLTDLLGGADAPQTLGGIVATNLSGPRRVAWGAMRDHVMGIRAVTGRAEIIRSGGRVLKNVTGLDLCKLLTGSHGTLGVITEITLKVLPAPEATGTLVLPGLDAAKAVALLSDALGSPYGVSGAAWLPADAASRIGAAKQPVALVRIEEFQPSVAYRIARLRDQFAVPGASVLDTEESRVLWRSVRDARPLPGGEAVWRVSVRPSAGPVVLEAVQRFGVDGFLDWGGGLVWLTGPATPAAHLAIEAVVTKMGGTWTLMRAPDALRGSVRVVPDEVAPLARIRQAVKAAMDPAGILNPGRLYAGV